MTITTNRAVSVSSIRGQTWSALVPQKALNRAKGRLDLPTTDRHQLAVAMLRDTVTALNNTAGLAHIFMLWEDPSDAGVVPETQMVHHVSAPDLDLNGAIQLGQLHARVGDSDANVVVVPSDLPALTPIQMREFLQLACRHERSFLADADGVGTSLLAATRGHSLLPCYGVESRQRHRDSGARDLSGQDLPSLRRDVDNLRSLGVAMSMGCGVHTSGAVDELVQLAVADTSGRCSNSVHRARS